MTSQSSSLQPTKRWHSIRNVLVKSLALFILLNLVFAWWYPMPGLGKISAYNRLFPGRERLPYSENPPKAYSLSLYNLEAMLKSHELAAGDKPMQEYRAILIGDSATWGFLLPVEHTLSAYLNAADIHLADGRQLRAYNLGYPVMSLTKDLLILSYALRYEPDLIIWPLTLESFPYDKQLFHPLLQNNPAEVRNLIQTYGLQIDPLTPEFVELTFLERTLIGARRSLADLLRLQLYGVMWAATRIDQDIPETYTPRMQDLPADESFHDLLPPHLDSQDLALDVLSAAERMVGDVPLLIINEPMFISQGENSDIRYNFFYPRWVYDDYRAWMQSQSAAQGWYYYDMWDAIPDSEFTNSAVHLTPKGNQLFAQKVIEAILETTRDQATE